MKCSEGKDYIYCPHCNENVFRYTDRRHRLMSVKRKREARSSSSDYDSSEPSELDPQNVSLESFDIQSGKWTLYLFCIIIHCLFTASIISNKNIGHCITQFVVSCDNFQPWLKKRPLQMPCLRFTMYVTLVHSSYTGTRGNNHCNFFV